MTHFDILLAFQLHKLAQVAIAKQGKDVYIILTIPTYYIALNNGEKLKRGLKMQKVPFLLLISITTIPKAT